ncbi:hypothetical protein BSKO_04349 [Bryopsis sp. KO-2023]|nr:hypothetical protein BSKO_04349 [Bryopsis sp. KO-2023]
MSNTEGAREAGKMKLKVKTLPNGEHDLEVATNIKVEQLKEILFEVTNIALDRQRLIWRGRVLNDGEMLREHGVEDGHTLHLVERSAAAPPPGQPQSQPGNQPQMQQGNAARISVNLGGPGGAGLQDIGRMVQGVLRAVGMEGGVPMQVQMGGRVVQGEPGQAQNPPPPAGAARQQGVGPRQDAGGSQNPPPVEDVPHLLSTIRRYIDRLDEGGLPTRTLPVISLTPPTPEPGQNQPPQFSQEIQALTASLCNYLQDQEIPDDLRRQLNSAQATLSSDTNEADQNNVRFSLRFGGGGDPAPVESYSHLPLLVAALGRLVSRADTLFRERASRSLANACQQLLAATEVDESNQELLAGGVRQIASVLNWYGALFVELARVAACAVPALQGNIIPLAANTAAVIGADGTHPNFRLLFPRGLHDNQENGAMQAMGQQRPGVPGSGPQQRANLGEGMVPHVGIVAVSGQEQAPGVPANAPVADRVDVTVIEPSGQMFTASAGGQTGGTDQPAVQGGDLGSMLGPLVQQLASGVMGNLQQGQPGNPTTDGTNAGNAGANVMQAMAAALGGLANNQAGAQAPPPGNPAVESQRPPSTTPAAGPRTAPPQNPPTSGPPQTTQGPRTTSSTAARGVRGPAGLGLGPRLGPRRGARPTSGPRPGATATATTNPSTDIVSRQAPNPTSAGNPAAGGGGGADLMSMLGGMLNQQGGGAGGPGGGPLAQLMDSVVNNPSLQRMAEDPQIRSMVDNVIGDDSPQDVGSLMNRLLPQMMPMMGQLFGGGSGNSRQTQAPISDTVIDQQLTPEEASRWKQIISRDALEQTSNPPTEGVSEVYAAGESAGRSGGLMGLVDSIGEEEDSRDNEREGGRSDMYV